MRRPALTKTIVDGLEELMPFAIADEAMVASHGATARAQHIQRSIDYLDALIAWHRQRHPTP